MAIPEVRFDAAREYLRKVLNRRADAEKPNAIAAEIAELREELPEGSPNRKGWKG